MIKIVPATQGNSIKTILTNNMLTEITHINWQLEGLPASKQKEAILRTIGNMVEEIIYLQKDED